MHTERLQTVLKGAVALRGINVSSHAYYKEVANALVKDDLHRNARISAGQDAHRRALAVGAGLDDR